MTYFFMGSLRKAIASLFLLLCISIFFTIAGFYIGQNSTPLYNLTGANVIKKSDGQKIPEQPPFERGEKTGLKFFYGRIIDRNGNRLLIQEILLTGMYGANTYLVYTDQNTKYEYFASADIKKIDDSGQPKGKKGDSAAIKPKMYVFVATRDRLVSTPRIYAASISYSEESPIQMQPTEKK